MVGPLGGRNRQSFGGEVTVSQQVWEDMKTHAAKRPSTEVGGMLFGKFEENEEGVLVGLRVERVINVPPEHGINQSTYFEINDDFMSDVIDEYTPQYEYLGNWHSHLGYGGPSSGDYDQVRKFFEQNDHRQYLIAIIEDRDGNTRNPSYNQHFEIYRRTHEDTSDFEIHSPEHISLSDHPPEREAPAGGEKEDTQDLVEQLVDKAEGLDTDETLRSDLLNLISNLDDRELLDQSANGTIYQNTGAVDEVVALLPVQPEFDSDDEGDLGTNIVKEPYRAVKYRISDPDTDANKEASTIPALLGISLPATYPEGDIYVDIKSRSQTVQVTVKTIPGETLRDDIDRVGSAIEKVVKDKIPKTLESDLGTLVENTDGDSQ